MTMDPLQKYLDVFGKLHRHRNSRWGGAPHKPILLLAVFDSIDKGEVPFNCIKLTPELVAAFRNYWRVLVAANTWQERIANPFRFMIQEGFWDLLKDGIPVSTQTLGMNPTIRQLNTETDGAVLSSDLWEMLQDRSAASTLRTFLLQHYFSVGMAEVQPNLHAYPMEYEVELLKTEAQSRFQPGHVREDRDETGYYIRHALFPKVVKSLYNHACAVCGLNVRTDAGSSLIDTAHIMPFGLFHNDDPRNGVTLCKNHHWGFDAGWFTATSDYKILVSPHLQNSLTYLNTGALLLLPVQQEYAPAAEALAWHQQHVYRR